MRPWRWTWHRRGVQVRLGAFGWGRWAGLGVKPYTFKCSPSRATYVRLRCAACCAAAGTWHVAACMHGSRAVCCLRPCRLPTARTLLPPLPQCRNRRRPFRHPAKTCAWRQRASGWRACRHTWTRAMWCGSAAGTRAWRAPCCPRPWLARCRWPMWSSPLSGALP